MPQVGPEFVTGRWNLRLCAFVRISGGGNVREFWALNQQPRILIVEDSLMVAMVTAELAEECGCAVVGPVGSVSEGLATARGAQLDGAILDINLGDEHVWPVAELLKERAVPFIFVTGYTVEQVPEHFRDRPRVSKPLTLDRLCEALTSIGMMCA